MQGKAFKDKEGENIKEGKKNPLPQSSLLPPPPKNTVKTKIEKKNTSLVLSPFSALRLEGLVILLDPLLWPWLYLLLCLMQKSQSP